MAMADYIMAILRTQLMVVFSWGLHNPMKLPNDAGLAFRVNGYKHRGWVAVRYNRGRDLFTVELMDGDKRVIRQIEDVYFDTLVDTIDGAVEKTDDYDDRVKKQYNL
jgi:hypothetical protein